GYGNGGDADMPSPATPGEVGQGVGSRFGRAETVDQGAEIRGADIFGADEAEPGDALVVCQSRARPGHHAFPVSFFSPILSSVPAINRLMFSRWVMKRAIDSASVAQVSCGPEKAKANIGAVAAAVSAASEE